MQHHEPNFFNKTIFHSRRSFWCCLATTLLLVAGLSNGLSLAASTENTMTVAREAPEMFLPRDDSDLKLHSLATVQQAGRYPVRLNTGLSDTFLPLFTVSLSLPKGDQYEVIQDNRMAHPSGSVTWVGYIKDYGNDYRAVIITWRGRSFGRILTPTNGELLIGKYSVPLPLQRGRAKRGGRARE